MNELSKFLSDKLIKDIGNVNDVDITQLIENFFNPTHTLTESNFIDSGEPETAFYVDGAKRIINGAKPEVWFKQGGYTQLQKPKSDSMRGKGKNKDTDSQFRKVTYKLKGVAEPVTGKAGLPYKADTWKTVTNSKLKKKVERYWDVSNIDESIYLPKEVIEYWVQTRFKDVLAEISNTNSNSGNNNKDVDDGPNFFYKDYDTFDTISKERAEQIGYTIFKQIMSGEFEDYTEYPIYPNGPVKAVTPFPAGVIGKTTATNQKDFYGNTAYDLWFSHVTRSMGLVGYEIVKDKSDIIRKLSVDAAIDIENNKSTKRNTLTVNEMGIPMGYPSKKQLIKKQKEMDILRKKMDTDTDYYTEIDEDITIPVKVGDTVLMGKFKNKKVVVKDIGKDDRGLPTINGRKVVNFRLTNETYIIETVDDYERLKKFKTKMKSIDELYKESIDELLEEFKSEGLLTEIPMDDLIQIDKYADKQLNPVDVVITDKHFMDRLVDPRNKKPISFAELIGFFKRLGDKKDEFVEFLRKYGEVVAKDKRTDINIPFMRMANKAIAKTIMRKADFKTPSPELKLEAQSVNGNPVGVLKKKNENSTQIINEFVNLTESITKEGISAYYTAICKVEGITPLPIKFEKVGKGGAALTYNSTTMKPIYISFDMGRMSDPEYAVLHELTHQIKLETEKDSYNGKRDQLAKFKKLENRLVEKYMYSKYSNLIWKTKNVNEDLVRHFPTSLGVKREHMPQISSNDIHNYIEYLRTHNIDVKGSMIPISKVKMTQKDLNLDKVNHLLTTSINSLSKPVIISKDNYILDGHHRVVALYNIDNNFKLHTIKVNTPIRNLLTITKEYPNVFYKKITESTISGMGGGNNSARWTAPKQSKKLSIEQLSGYIQMDFPIADELDISNEKHHWMSSGKTQKYHNKVKATRTSDGRLVLEAMENRFKIINESGSIPDVIPIPASIADTVIKEFIKTIVIPSKSINVDTITGLGSTRSILKKLPGAKSVAGDLDLLAVATTDRKSAVDSLVTKAKSMGLDYQIAFGNVFSVGYPYEGNKYQIDLMVAEASDDNAVYNYMRKFKFWSDEDSEQDTSFILKGAHRSELAKTIVKAVGLSAAEGGFNEFVWNNKYNDVNSISDELNKKAVKFRDIDKQKQTIELASLILNKVKDINRLKKILSDDGYIKNRYPHSLFKSLPKGFDIMVDMLFDKVQSRDDWETTLDKKFNLTNTIERMNKFDDVVKLIKELIGKKILTPRSVVQVFVEMKGNFDKGKAAGKWDRNLEEYIEKEFPFLKGRW